MPGTLLATNASMQSISEVPSPALSNLPRADHVCKSCKRKKRKCDKALPTCSQCIKGGVRCDYSKSEGPAICRFRHASVSISPNAWPLNHGVNEDDQNRSEAFVIDYPTVSFLDPALLQHGQLDFAQRPTPIASHLWRILGTLDDVRCTADRYFQHVHTWLPFICKPRFHGLYQRSSLHLHADVILLLLAVKLITTPPPDSPRNPRTQMYHTIKHFYVEVETSSALSLHVLQAGVLLALYEIAHGIYPAAYLSLAGCARFARAIGVNVSRSVKSRRFLTLVEMEERRRVWWAIVILDRFVNIGSPGRPLAATDPQPHDLLPVEDTSWDEGIVKPDDLRPLSAPNMCQMSRFALLCQAARLLGQFLNTTSSDDSLDSNEVSLQLNRTLQSMLSASLEVENPDWDQISFIHSALTALNMTWLPNGNSSTTQPESEQSRRAQAFLKQLSETIDQNLMDGQCMSHRDPEGVPPWGLYFSYRVCVIALRSPPGLLSGRIVDALRKQLGRIDSRWNAAGIYLQLLEAHEVMIAQE